MPKTENRVARKVKRRLDEHTVATARAKEFKQSKQPQSDVEKWELAWSRQIEVFDGWLKPAVRAGADYQAERYEVQEGVELRALPSRSLIVPPGRIDIAPVAGFSEDGQRMGRLESLSDKYTLFWNLKNGAWTVGKITEHTTEVDLTKLAVERRKKLKLPALPKQKPRLAERKEWKWDTQLLTRERFEEIIEELL